MTTNRTLHSIATYSGSAGVARQVLAEVNPSLLLDTGHLTETGLRRTSDGGLNASWALIWPAQRAAGVQPIALQAHFGGGLHHPVLRGTTVYRSDYRIVPAITAKVFTPRDPVGNLQ
jgi:hypothetical protein